MRGVYAFFWKGIKEFFASKESVFWTFIFPIIFGLLFASVFASTSVPKNIPVGYVPEGGNATLSTMFIHGMENVSIENKSIFIVHKFANESMGMESLHRGKIKALIIFDNNFTENATFGKMRMHIIFDKRDLYDYQVTSGTLLSYISRFEDTIRDRKIDFAVTYITKNGNVSVSPELIREYLDSMANPVNMTEGYYTGESQSAHVARIWYATAAIGVTIVFSGMIGAASSISGEIEKGTARRLSTTKTRPVEMLTGVLLYLLIVQLISALLVLLSFAMVFREWIPISLEILGMLLIAALSTISIGLLISSLTRTQKAATAATNAIAWPISFITGIFFPSFLLPEWMRFLGDFFPASALLRGVRKIVIYNEPLGTYMPVIIAAIVITTVLLILGGVAFAWKIKRV